MITLRLIDKQRQALGTITWVPPDQVRVEIADPDLAAAIRDLVARGREPGLPLRGGGPARGEGEKGVLVETVEPVRPDDERFLRALADAINGRALAGQRVFAVVTGGG